MPTTKKKITKKSTTKTKKKVIIKKNKLSPIVNVAEPVDNKLIIPEKKFINVYDKDPIIQTKSRLSWLIVGIIMLGIIFFWFWSLKMNMGGMRDEYNDSTDLNKITSEINSVITEFHNMIGNTKNVINQNNNEVDQQNEIEKIKNDVLAQIQINSDSANWPQHSSKLLGLSLKYPTNWFKQEKKDLLILSSYNLESTSTPEISTKIIITKIASSNTKIESLIDNKSDYIKSSEEIFIDLIPAEKYNKIINEENVLSYLLFINNTKNIYKIDIYSNNKNIFEATINKILSTIDLL